MPRVDANVTCTGNSRVNIEIVKRAIAEVISSITGQGCQVTVVTTGGGGVSDKITAYKMQAERPSNNIEMYPTSFDPTGY